MCPQVVCGVWPVCAWRAGNQTRPAASHLTSTNSRQLRTYFTKMGIFSASSPFDQYIGGSLVTCTGRVWSWCLLVCYFFIVYLCRPSFLPWFVVRCSILTCSTFVWWLALHTTTQAAHWGSHMHGSTVVWAREATPAWDNPPVYHRLGFHGFVCCNCQTQYQQVCSHSSSVWGYYMTFLGSIFIRLC